ncbi:hypothetical protein ACIQ34_04705 [Ureibacillus sp. NPDC094379]
MFGLIFGSVFRKKDQNQLINKMNTLEENQVSIYQLFENEIKALQQGPFETGMLYLQDAKKEHRTEKDAEQLIEQARKEFMSSCGILKGKKDMLPIDLHYLGVTQSYVAMCWLMLNKPLDAQDYIEDSIKTLNDAEIKFREENQVISNVISSIEQSEYNYLDLLKKGEIKTIWNRYTEADGYNEQKKKLPRYRSKLENYRKALGETSTYKAEMIEIRGQILENVQKLETSKAKKQELIDGLKDTTVKMITNEKVNELVTVENIKKIGSFFKKKN